MSNEYEVFINGEHDGKALKMTLFGNHIHFDGYTPDKPIEPEVIQSDASDAEEKYCIVVGRRLGNGIFWQIVWYSEKYDLIHMSQLKDEDKTDPEAELAQYFSMNKCYEIIVKHKLNLTGDYVVIKQAGTESKLQEG